MEKIDIDKLSFLNESQSKKLKLLLKNLGEYDSKFESPNKVFEYGNSGFCYPADILQKVNYIIFKKLNLFLNLIFLIKSGRS
jgi:hypothetical protein